MAGSFSAKVSDWVAASRPRIAAVRNMAVEAVVEEAQALAPVDTGFLRASIVATVGGAVPLKRERSGDGPFAWSGEDVALALAAADFDDIVTIAWSANYARFVEYGARGRPGRAFVRLAAQNWPQQVARASAMLQGQVMGREGLSVYQTGR